MRLAIIGSRTCPLAYIGFYLPFVPDIIVSGGTKRADTYAQEYAVKDNILLIEFLPDYQKYGRKVPLLRNLKIVDNCDSLLAFCDGKSRGTKFTIDYAEKREVPSKIIIL